MVKQLLTFKHNLKLRISQLLRKFIAIWLVLQTQITYNLCLMLSQTLLLPTTCVVVDCIKFIKLIFKEKKNKERKSGNMVEKSGIYTVTGFYNCCWKNKNKKKTQYFSQNIFINMFLDAHTTKTKQSDFKDNLQSGIF